MQVKSFRVIRHGKVDRQPSVVAIGNFDGFHVGHQDLIKQLKALAKDYHATPTMLLFYPHPRHYFNPQQAPRMIMSLAEKLKALADAGISQVVVRRFDACYAGLSAADFIKDELVSALGAKAVLVGHDFRFGAKRQGSIETLKQAQNVYGFTTCVSEPVCYQRQRISSTWLREALAQGDCALYHALTWRDLCFSGIVVQGEQQGRVWGVPTANLRLRHNPGLSGVFAGRVLGDGWQANAAISVGHRPVVGGGERLLEAHLLDFDRMIYGEHIRVSLVQKIRNQEHFHQTSELIAAMQADIQTARQLLS